MSLSKETSSVNQPLTPKSGKWLKRLSIFAFLILPLTVVGYRFGFYQFSTALKLLAVSLLVAAITFLAGLFINLKQRNSDRYNSKQAQLAMYISLRPLFFLGSQVVTAKSFPVIHNISTDIVDPPRFNKIVALRGTNSNSHLYNATEIGEIQKSAYPQIKTLIVTDSMNDAFNRSLSVTKKLGWDLVSSDQQAGIIEASQTTQLWAFTDDVVIRISNVNDKTEIDLRSVSRVGRSDLGANAKRIDTFFKTYLE